MLQHGVSESVDAASCVWAQWIRTAAMGSVRGNVYLSGGVSRAREGVKLNQSSEGDWPVGSEELEWRRVGMRCDEAVLVGNNKEM